MTDRILSNRAIAAELGISEGAIRKSIKSGRITGEMTLENVRYCLASSQTRRTKADIAPNADYTPPPRQLQPRHDYVASVDKRINQMQDSTTGNLEGLTLTEIKAVREAILAKKDELELFEREGALSDTDGMRKAQQVAGRIVRETMEAIPAKISAEIAAESDIAKVMHTLENTIRDALDAVAQQLVG